MKKSLLLLFVLACHVMWAQNMFNVRIDKAASCNELMSEGYRDKSYQTILKGSFIVLDVFMEKTSNDSPRSIDAEQVQIVFGDKTFECIGRLDPTTRLLENRWSGLSFYGRGRNEILIFEVTEKIESAKLKFNEQEVPFSIKEEWVHVLPMPSLKVKSVETIDKLNQQNNPFGPERNYNIVIKTEGSFTIVEVEVMFSEEASPRASDFFLKDKNGALISAIGDMHEEHFRHNGNTGSLRLDPDIPGTVKLVFPTGKLSAEDLKKNYVLTYAGIAEVSL